MIGDIRSFVFRGSISSAAARCLASSRAHSAPLQVAAPPQLSWVPRLAQLALRTARAQPADGEESGSWSRGHSSFTAGRGHGSEDASVAPRLPRRSVTISEGSDASSPSSGSPSASMPGMGGRGRLAGRRRGSLHAELEELIVDCLQSSAPAPAASSDALPGALKQMGTLIRRMAGGGDDAYAACLAAKRLLDGQDGAAQESLVAGLSSGLDVLAALYLRRRPPQYSLEQRVLTGWLIGRVALNDLGGIAICRMGPLLAAAGFVADPAATAARLESGDEEQVEVGLFELATLSMDHRSEGAILRCPQLVTWVGQALAKVDNAELFVSRTASAPLIVVWWAAHGFHRLLTALAAAGGIASVLRIARAPGGAARAGFATGRNYAVAILAGFAAAADALADTRVLLALPRALAEPAMRSALRVAALGEIRKPLLRDAYERLMGWALAACDAAAADDVLREHLVREQTPRPGAFILRCAQLPSVSQPRPPSIYRKFANLRRTFCSWAPPCPRPRRGLRDRSFGPPRPPWLPLGGRAPTAARPTPAAA